MSFKFETLKIWQMSMDYAEEIYNISKDFPKDEIYNLTSQMRRAVDSVALNISEGAILQSVPEFQRFMGYAIRSLAEVVTCLHKSKRRKYISEEQFSKYYNEAYLLMNMMIAFRKTL